MMSEYIQWNSLNIELNYSYILFNSYKKKRFNPAIILSD